MFPDLLGSLFCQSVMWVPSVRQSPLRLCSKIIGHCQFVQFFPSVPEMISKLKSQPFSIGLRDFFVKWSQKIRNLSLSRKIFEHCHFFLLSFYIVKHIRLYIVSGFRPSVRPSEFAILFWTVSGFRACLIRRKSHCTSRINRKNNWSI